MRLHSRSIVSTLTLFLSASAVASLPQTLWMRSLSSGISDYMGSSLASGKLFLAAGAPWDSEFGPNNGSVLIYRGQYSLQYQQVIWGRWQVGLGGDEQLQFGYSMAGQDHLLYVGAPGDDDGSGSVIMIDTSTSPEPTYVDSIENPASAYLAINDQFGYSIDIDGDWMVIGAPGCMNDSGAAWVFRNTHGSQGWMLHTELVSPWPQENARFGHDVAIHDGRIAVGAPYRDELNWWDDSMSAIGAVTIFELDSQTWGYAWNQVEWFQASDIRTDNMHYGWSVEVLDHQVFAGAPNASHTNGTANAGRVHVLTYDSRVDLWYQSPSLILESDTPHSGMGWGSSISTKDTTLLIGAPFADHLNDSSGLVTVWCRGEMMWTWHETLECNVHTWKAALGQAVHIDDERALAGAPQAADGQNDWAGIIAWWDRGLFECPSFDLDDARDIKTIDFKRSLENLQTKKSMNQ
ncbi:MAG: FG-GAP repeat protein [Planctomycetota bacterium]|nr:FG-GAP repeat protein [Planctomycetota bacterium]